MVIAYSFLFFTFLFLNNYRLPKSFREVPCTHYPDSPNDNILYNYSPLSKPGSWHVVTLKVFYLEIVTIKMDLGPTF